MQSIEIDLFNCPKCKRVLKPSIEKDTIQELITFEGPTIVQTIEIHTPDLLECRYCKIKVRPSLLRQQKDPIKYLKQFTKVPKKTEISEEEKEKIRLRENHKENMKKYKHYPVPKKCIECKSEDLVADSSDFGWVCLSCDSWFEWKSYSIHFFGDVEVNAENRDDAIERAYDLLGDNCKVDIEAEVDDIRWRG